MVVVEQSAQSLRDLDATHALGLRSTDEPVPNALMTTLIVIVGGELRDRSDEGFSPQKDHLIQTLRPDRSHEPFGVGIHVRCLVRSE